MSSSSSISKVEVFWNREPKSNLFCSETTTIMTKVHLKSDTNRQDGFQQRHHYKKFTINET